LGEVGEDDWVVGPGREEVEKDGGEACLWWCWWIENGELCLVRAC